MDDLMGGCVHCIRMVLLRHRIVEASYGIVEASYGIPEASYGIAEESYGIVEASYGICVIYITHVIYITQQHAYCQNYHLARLVVTSTESITLPVIITV